MTGNRHAQRAFDAGVLSLGLSIDGQESSRDLEYAALAFQRATKWDPGMCDAWLGRAPAGELTEEVLFNLYKTCDATLYREQRRVGLRPRELKARFQPGLYIDYPLSSRTEISLAWAAASIWHSPAHPAPARPRSPGWSPRSTAAWVCCAPRR